jgi:anaerobic magnesium-protoporphyrin IX monomethyl ester cyclase
MKERVGLIIPPSPFLADERVFPSLGILKVASALESRGHEVDVLDLSGIGNYQDVVATYMSGPDRAKVIGVTATTPQFPQAVRINETIKAIDPDTKTLLGGAHATMVGSAKQLDEKRNVRYRGTIAFEQMTSTFDTTVIGDGEEAIFDALTTGNAVVDAGNKNSIHFLQRGTLEQYPLPARHLIDMDSYHYQIDGRDAQSMIAQLGCPFECGFCGGRNTQSFRMIRTRSVESTLAEVDELVGRYNKRGIMFYDDELNVNNNALMQLMEGLISYQEKRGVDLRLRGFVKAELFTAEQAKIMRRAGFRVMLSGVESGDDGILKTMRKHTTREINSRWVQLCREAGLQTKALMSIGHPGETKETILNSLEWVLANRPDDVDWTIITQYPGSPYFDKSVPHPTQAGTWVFTDDKTHQVLYSQDVNYAQRAEYYKGVPGDYTSYVWTDALTPKDLVGLRDDVEKISRYELGLSPIQSVAARQFEHSMGQRTLPTSVLRRTHGQ